jgi:hypothetical protein
MKLKNIHFSGTIVHRTTREDVFLEVKFTPLAELYIGL